MLEATSPRIHQPGSAVIHCLISPGFCLSNSSRWLQNRKSFLKVPTLRTTGTLMYCIFAAVFNLPSCFYQNQIIFLPVTRKANLYKKHRIQQEKLGMLLKDLSTASKNTTSLDTETRSLLSSSVFNAGGTWYFSITKFLVRKKRVTDSIVGRNHNGDPVQPSFHCLKRFSNIPHRRSLKSTALEMFQRLGSGKEWEWRTEAESVSYSIYIACCMLPIWKFT